LANEEEVEVAAKAAETVVSKAAKDAFQEVEEDVLKQVEQDAAKAGADAAGTDATRQALIDELRRNGVKFSEDDLLKIGRDRSGKVVFLEEGSSSAGLQHILDEHADDFARRGAAAPSTSSSGAAGPTASRPAWEATASSSGPTRHDTSGGTGAGAQADA
jgi:hypothetical protein